MKKKILALCLVIALAVTAVTGATLAYFTDNEKATNTFVAGGVSIDLDEFNNDNVKDDQYREWLKTQVLMPGDNKTNTIAKNITIKNDGKSDTYVRLHIAIPSVLDNAQPDFDASKNLLHFNCEKEVLVDGKWNWGTKAVAGRTSFVGTGDEWNSYTTKVDGIDYNVYVVTYETALEPDEVTEKAMTQVYLYKDVTNEDIQKANATLGTEWKILVAAEGGQVDGFADAFTALNTQFGVPGEYVVAWN